MVDIGNEIQRIKTALNAGSTEIGIGKLAYLIDQAMGRAEYDRSKMGRLFRHSTVAESLQKAVDVLKAKGIDLSQDTAKEYCQENNLQWIEQKKRFT